MINAAQLLADLKKLRKSLEADLRQYHAASAGRAAIEKEWQEARKTKRTADTFVTFFDAALDQAAVHWILAAVFLRFLEDNFLIDRPVVSGPGERLELAQLRQRDWFRTRPEDSDAEYLLALFAELARLPGLSGLFDPVRNPLFRLPVSGDGAIVLFDFFRRRAPETGELLHDFTDPEWNTRLLGDLFTYPGWKLRFLGDLYQDLSEEARKRYALLQTPEFVEEWILSRTLDPAIREFGYQHVRMIDPACGSGHFLLGAFVRLLAEWQRHAPDMPPAAQAQEALDAVAGVDLNPFAVEITRFRLLLAALRAAGEKRLAAAPDFRFQLATGDSLLHGRHFTRQELGGPEEGFRRILRHHYVAEDTTALDRILGRQYHVVVGNPPYITPKDAAMRDAYREIYESCHMKYGLGVPFTERFFDLAQEGTDEQSAGYVGFIVANSFMKREFGKKLIETVLPRLDLTHIVDCSGAYIPGHGTPTVILFGRNRPPVDRVVRTVRGVRGEPSAPADPARGVVWSAIVSQTDLSASTSEFISTEDTPRETLSHHPWNMGGGGASDIQSVIEKTAPKRLGQVVAVRRYAVWIGDRQVSRETREIGVFGMTNADEAMLADKATFRRAGCERTFIRELVVGDVVRDWRLNIEDCVIFPYADHGLVQVSHMPMIGRWLWPARTTMGNRATFNQKTYFAEGRPWWEWHQVALDRLQGLTITFAFVATHNHFVLVRGGKVFGRTAPIIKLPAVASDDDYLGLLGVLNSSTACFWMKQTLMDRGNGGIGGGIANERWERFYEHDSGKVGRFPISAELPLDLSIAIDAAARQHSTKLPASLCADGVPRREALDTARASAEAIRMKMVALQEELDWRCYRLYDLAKDALEHPTPPPLRLGERAFEIVMARRMAAGELETTWFERHRSVPITDLPQQWPADYRAIVARRIALIESNPAIGLIERPECKRRWPAPNWEEMERDALRSWLLDRLEDPRFWPASEQRMLSTVALADLARHDADFLSVAELYAGRAGVDLDALVAELVASESVPFLAALRYTESGLRKRADWEATWEKQRAEDAIDAELVGQRDEFLRAAWARMNPHKEGETAQAFAIRMAAGLGDEAVQIAAAKAIAEEAKDRKKNEIGDIPVPPKYKATDFQSQDFWRLRGALDVPKERFVSFPHGARDADPSLPVLWAGYDHLARARALAAWYVERKDTDGWPAERLKPLLAGILELVPWLRQWHNDMDAETGLHMGDFFQGYVEEEARQHGLTLDDLRAWMPPAPTRRGRGRRTSA